MTKNFSAPRELFISKNDNDIKEPQYINISMGRQEHFLREVDENMQVEGNEKNVSTNITIVRVNEDEEDFTGEYNFLLNNFERRKLAQKALMRHQQRLVKLPFPIFDVSLPKSGTTSLTKYFHCGKIWSAHTFSLTNYYYYEKEDSKDVGHSHNQLGKDEVRLEIDVVDDMDRFDDINDAENVVNNNRFISYPNSKYSKIKSLPKQKIMRIGQCFYVNLLKGKKPFEDCGDYNVWSDTGFPRMKEWKNKSFFTPSGKLRNKTSDTRCSDDDIVSNACSQAFDISTYNDTTPQCFYPSIHMNGLQAYYEAYPNSTIVQLTRNAAMWARSILRWQNGKLYRNWNACNLFMESSKVTSFDNLHKSVHFTSKTSKRSRSRRLVSQSLISSSIKNTMTTVTTPTSRTFNVINETINNTNIGTTQMTVSNNSIDNKSNFVNHTDELMDYMTFKLIQFYKWHVNRIRHFALSHPSLTYVEHSLDGSDLEDGESMKMVSINQSIGYLMENSFGIRESCFRHVNNFYSRQEMQKKQRRKRVIKSFSNRKNLKVTKSPYERFSMYPDHVLLEKGDHS